MRQAMRADNSRTRFFLVIVLFMIVFLGYLSYRVMEPFFVPIGWAIVLSVVFYPVYVVVHRVVRLKWLASVITMGFILLALLGPISYVTLMLAGEVREFAERADSGSLELHAFFQHPRVVWIVERISRLVPSGGADLEKMAVEGIHALRTRVVEIIGLGARNVIKFGVNFFLMLFAIFFILRDGPGFAGKIRGHLPFSEEQKDRLEKQTKDMIVSTIYGGVVVALIQGSVGGMVFWALGLSAPVLWGAAIFIMSFIPMLGTFSIWGPAALYLFLTGEMAKGLILSLVGAFVISTVDNILKPIIISSRTRMHTLLIFFSVLGGINLFGILGLIMGPLTLALFITVFEIFGNIGGAADDNHRGA
jgi:predicted PurR-regulated permease PerM